MRPQMFATECVYNDNRLLIKAWIFICHYDGFLINKGVPLWLSGRALRQLRKRLWVRFPGNTCTNENV